MNVPEKFRRKFDQCVTCNKRPDPSVRFSCCGRCKVAVYCSKECQCQDWPTHKKQCGFQGEELKKKADTLLGKWIQKNRRNLNGIQELGLGRVKTIDHMLIVRLSFDKFASADKSFRITEVRPILASQYRGDKEKDIMDHWESNAKNMHKYYGKTLWTGQEFGQVTFFMLYQVFDLYTNDLILTKHTGEMIIGYVDPGRSLHECIEAINSGR